MLTANVAMDFTKKRKTDENGNVIAATTSSNPAVTSALSPEDIRKIIEPFSKDQLLDILQTASLIHADVLDAVRSVADPDASLRKLFVRGLSPETTSDGLGSIFAPYGELDEAIVIFDKNTGKSKGYGFVTFKHVDGARLALKEPSKKIDGRMTVTQLASAGLSNSGPASDVSMRKIYVGNVPFEITSERLLSSFLVFGEIEEGPLGFDKAGPGKTKGFAFFIYKTEEGARAAIAEPLKVIDGHQVLCKLAVDNKKVKTQTPGGAGDNVQPPPPLQTLQPPQPQSSIPGSQYPGSLPGYGYPGFASASTTTTSYGPNASIGGGSYGSFYGVSQYGGPGLSDLSSVNNPGNSMYRLPSSSAGMGSVGYLDGSGPYGLSQQLQPPTFPPRVPPGGMNQGMPPYY
uniref:Uncharacterized protein MANES_16G038000 n=1 Tax=Rhizophora mucronata TaxID=61149 RepID=A0A2P2JU60_RHIMU